MHVVVVGNDTGAVRVALELGRAPQVHVTIVSAATQFVAHSPLLHALQFATGEMQAQLLKDAVKGYPNIKVVQDEPRSIDTDRRLLRGAARSYSYDHLVISRHEPSSHAQSIGTLTNLITTLKTQYETGQTTDTEIVVMGHDVESVKIILRLQEYCDSLYKGSDSKVRLSLVTTRTKILPEASVQCRKYVKRHMARLGVTIQEGAHIDTSSPGLVRINRKKLPAAQVVTVETRSADTFFASQPIIFDLDGSCRVRLSPYLEAYDHVYVIGAATQILTDAMPTRILDMAEYVADRIISPHHTLPYTPATAAMVIPLHAKAAYVEYFGMYVTGVVGAWACRMVAHRSRRLINQQIHPQM